MVANIRGYTHNYNFKLINFDTPRWHTLEYANWQMLDTLLLLQGTPQARGSWLNSTLYAEGDRVFDDDTGDLYRCVVPHTSSPTGTFAQDRNLHPNYWSLQTLGVPLFRGVWVPAAFYALGDIVVGAPYEYYLCVEAHTSSATFPPDIAKWQLIFDASETVTDSQAAAAAAASSASSAAASATAAQVAKIVWRGPWSSVTAYVSRDAVQDAGTSYISKTSNTNKPPGANPSDWDIMALKGDQGIQGIQGPQGIQGIQGPQGPTGAAGSGSGDMLRSLNLSDVLSAPTAFTNIKQAATLTATGVVELATDSETTTKTDTSRAVTPSNIGALTATVAPLMNGTQALGTSVKFAKEDHVHATDTSRAPINNPTFTGVQQGTTPANTENSVVFATTAWVKTILGLGTYTTAIPDGIVTLAKIATSAIATIAELLARGTTKLVAVDVLWDSGTFVSLTDGATVTPDFSQGYNFQWTIGAAGRTLANPTNFKPTGGQSGMIYINAGASGTITAWGTAWKFPGGVKPSLTLGGADCLVYTVRSSSVIICNMINDVR